MDKISATRWQLRLWINSCWKPIRLSWLRFPTAASVANRPTSRRLLRLPLRSRTARWKTSASPRAGRRRLSSNVSAEGNFSGILPRELPHDFKSYIERRDTRAARARLAVTDDVRVLSTISFKAVALLDSKFFDANTRVIGLLRDISS